MFYYANEHVHSRKDVLGLNYKLGRLSTPKFVKRVTSKCYTFRESCNMPRNVLTANFHFRFVYQYSIPKCERGG